VYFCVVCLIEVPPGKNPFALQLNNNNNNKHNSEFKRVKYIFNEVKEKWAALDVSRPVSHGTHAAVDTSAAVPH
jgi:hypothetical protein